MVSADTTVYIMMAAARVPIWNTSPTGNVGIRVIALGADVQATSQAGRCL